MKFNEHQSSRLEKGKKQYEIEGSWRDWKMNDFIDNAKEELVDCANYLSEMLSRLSISEKYELTEELREVRKLLECLYNIINKWKVVLD